MQEEGAWRQTDGEMNGDIYWQTDKQIDGQAVGKIVKQVSL